MPCGLPIVPGPSNYQKAYELAFDMAKEQLLRKDIEQVCDRSGATLKKQDKQQIITFRYLGDTYYLTLPEVLFSSEKMTLFFLFVNRYLSCIT